MIDDNALLLRSKLFNHAKEIKKPIELYKPKRFHFQLLALFSIAIISFVIGILYVHNCPIEPRIPVYLIVQGAVGLLIFIIYLIAIVYILYITKGTYIFIGTVAILTAFLGLFLFVWFIAGNVWIFRIANRVQFFDQMGTDSYCDSTLYHSAFWLLIVQYIMVVALYIMY